MKNWKELEAEHEELMGRIAFPILDDRPSHVLCKEFWEKVATEAYKEGYEEGYIKGCLVTELQYNK